VLSMFICIFSFNCSSIANTPEDNSASLSSPEIMSRGNILEIYKKAIELNEDFKKSVGQVDLGALREKRWRVEKYHEDYLEPAYNNMVKYLSGEDDINLLVAYFDLIVSFENSADEGLNIALGEILLKNPRLIKEAVNSYMSDKRRYVVNKIRSGWENVVVIHNLDKKDMQYIKASHILRELETNEYTPSGM
jgi:hypothetical protein